MNNELKLADDVYQSIERNGLMDTIKKHFGAGTHIRMCFSDVTTSAGIEVLELSVRSYNCLKRASIHTVGGVLDAISRDYLWRIRNLGKMSRSEIHVRIYEYGYYSMSERDRRAFAMELCDLNRDRYHA